MRLNRRQLIASAVAAPLLSAADKKPVLPPPPAEYPLYIGAYTKGTSKGILVARFNPATGAISQPELAVATPNPTFLAIHYSKRFLYAINEVESWNGQHTGSVSAFAFGPNYELIPLNQVSSKGRGPCHIALDSMSHVAVVANYGSGSIASYKIGADGKLSEAVSSLQFTGYGPIKGRQEGPHAHSNLITADNKFVITCDLGTDRLHIFELDDAAGSLVEHNPAYVRAIPGGGPRHGTFSPNDKFLYVCNEMGNSITAYQWDRWRGLLTEIQTVSTLPAGFKGESSTAEIRVHPQNGRLYVSNRGHDSISIFDMARDGKLTFADSVPSGGHTPRNFNFDPTGKWLLVAHQDSNNITVFELTHHGGLRPTQNQAKCGAPVCLRFLA
jgi:6-phosphogluconolactonase